MLKITLILSHFLNQPYFSISGNITLYGSYSSSAKCLVIKTVASIDFHIGNCDDRVFHSQATQGKTLPSGRQLAGK